MVTFWNKLSRIGRVIRGGDEHVEAKFEVAQTTADNRRHWANADGLSARAAVSPEVRRVVRIRSRYEADNNSWYRGMLRTAVNHIVGKGPQLQVTTGNRELDLRIEAAFQRWATHSDFAGQLRLMVEAYWRDGEVFARRIERPSQWPRTMQLGIEIVEADRVASPFDVSPFDEFTEDGIRLDQYTRELAYYVYDRHPGSTSAASTLSGRWEPSSDVLHLFREERPGQIRGIPRVTSGLQMLPIMRRQELATLFSADIQLLLLAQYCEIPPTGHDHSIQQTQYAAIRNALGTGAYAHLERTENQSNLQGEGTTQDKIHQRIRSNVRRCREIAQQAAKEANVGSHSTRRLEKMLGVAAVGNPEHN